MFDRNALKHDLEKAQSAKTSDPDLAARRSLGLRLVIEAREDQPLDDVVAAIREIDERFEVEPLFPEPDFEPLDKEDEGVTVLDRRGFVATLNGLSQQDVSQNLFDVAYGVRRAGNFARVVPDMPLGHAGRLMDPTVVDADTTDVPLLNDAWALKAMRVKEAWEAHRDQPGRGVHIGHPDTGWTNHVEWNAGGLDKSKQRNFVETGDPTNARDRLSRPGQPGHGTHTAAVMVAPGGIKDDYSGTTPPGRVTGVAPAALNVPLRAVTSVVIPPLYTEVARAIRWCIEKRLQVISLSLGGVPFTLHSDIFHRCVDAVRRQHIIVAASGNYIPEVPPILRVTVEPAWWDFVIGVSASTPADKPWELSGRPIGVEISAPGNNVLTATGHNPNGYSLGTGTSYATAHLAGVAALWLSHHFPRGYPSGGREAVHVFKDHLRKTARNPTGWDTAFGPGIVDAHQLMVTKPQTVTSASAMGPQEYSHTEALAHELAAESPYQVTAMLSEVLFADADVPAGQANAQGIKSWAGELRTILHSNPVLWQTLAEQVRRFPVSAESLAKADTAETAESLRKLITPEASLSMRETLRLRIS